MAEPGKKEKSFWDFRDTILEGGILDIVGTQEKIKSEEARRKTMEDRTGLSFKDLVKFGLSKGAPKNDHVRAANIGMSEIMKGSAPPPEPGATNIFGEPIESKEILEFRKGITDRDEMLAQREELKKQIDEAKLKAEEEATFLDTPKGRLQTWWADADKREAVLSGITDAMTETRTGEDVYGSRLNQAQKNIRQNLKMAEATDVARAQAALNMQKTAAETSKLLNPAQFMSDTQREASDIASMEHVYGSPEWKTKYASEIRRIAYKDMLSRPVDAIMAINEYMFKMGGSIDPTMKDIYTDIINQLMGTIQGATGGTGAASVRGVNDIIGKTGQE